MANDSFNLFVSIFVNFSINSLKENGENLNYHSIQRRKVELYLFLSPHRELESFFVSSSFGYDQGEHCCLYESDGVAPPQYVIFLRHVIPTSHRSYPYRGGQNHSIRI